MTTNNKPTATPQLDAHAEFESWISAPPYEKSVVINLDSSAWPGQYQDYEVQLAWEAYRAGRAEYEKLRPAYEFLTRENLLLKSQKVEILKACNHLRNARRDLTAELDKLVEALELIKKGEGEWGAFRWKDCHNIAVEALAAYRKQRPAPDVAGLVEALRILATAGHRLNNEAEECTHDDGMAEVAGSECWCEFRDALEAADGALAAYRKGSEV